MYRHVLFDADGTLFDFDTAEETSLRQTIAHAGLEATDTLCAGYRAENKRLWSALERGQITMNALQRQRFLALLTLMGDARQGAERDEAADALNEYYLRRLTGNGTLYPGALALCRALSARYTLSIATNGVASTQRGRFEASGLAPYIKGGLFISQEMGVFKPDPAYFFQVMKALGDENPRHYLMIGDSLTSDIAGGRAAGMDTCWLERGSAQNGSAESTFCIKTLEELPAILKRGDGA